jgi:hypothetical protein
LQIIYKKVDIVKKNLKNIFLENITACNKKPAAIMALKKLQRGPIGKLF